MSMSSNNQSSQALTSVELCHQAFSHYVKLKSLKPRSPYPQISHPLYHFCLFTATRKVTNTVFIKLHILNMYNMPSATNVISTSLNTLTLFSPSSLYYSSCWNELQVLWLTACLAPNSCTSQDRCSSGWLYQWICKRPMCVRCLLPPPDAVCDSLWVTTPSWNEAYCKRNQILKETSWKILFLKTRSLLHIKKEDHNSESDWAFYSKPWQFCRKQT